MRQDIRNISYTIEKSKSESDLIYKIDNLLYQEIDSRFAEYEKYNNLDKSNYEILMERDEIVRDVVETLMSIDYEYSNDLINDETQTDETYLKANEKRIDTQEYKYDYLVNKEFIKILEQVKKRYTEENKVLQKMLKQEEEEKKQELITRLELHFNYCFNQCKGKITADILTLMSMSDFRKSTIEDLKLNTSDYKDFNKIYDKTLADFKKRHRYDLIDVEQEEKPHVGFGWTLYATTKIIEGLFKI